MTIAVGPCSASANASMPAFFSAMRVKLFLTIRYSPLSGRNLARNSFISVVLMPLKAVTIRPLLSLASLVIFSTICFLASVGIIGLLKRSDRESCCHCGFVDEAALYLEAYVFGDLDR